MTVRDIIWRVKQKIRLNRCIENETGCRRFFPFFISRFDFWNSQLRAVTSIAGYAGKSFN